MTFTLDQVIAAVCVGAVVAVCVVLLVTLWLRAMNDDRRDKARAERVCQNLRVACAWCGIEIKSGIEPTSHGCCPSCLAGQLASVEREEKKWRDTRQRVPPWRVGKYPRTGRGVGRRLRAQ